MKIRGSESGILLDRNDCTDIDGNKITCIDKLAQRNEIWLYLTTRASQLNSIATWASDTYKKTKDGG